MEDPAGPEDPGDLVMRLDALLARTAATRRIVDLRVGSVTGRLGVVEVAPGQHPVRALADFLRAVAGELDEQCNRRGGEPPRS